MFALTFVNDFNVTNVLFCFFGMPCLCYSANLFPGFSLLMVWLLLLLFVSVPCVCSFCFALFQYQFLCGYFTLIKVIHDSRHAKDDDNDDNKQPHWATIVIRKANIQTHVVRARRGRRETDQQKQQKQRVTPRA